VKPLKKINMLTYAIINTTDKDKVNFEEVIQEPSTVRYSLDGTQFVIKYETEPSFITNGSVVPDAILNHADCLILMNTSNWSQDII
jgi:hypothetical protein